MKSAILSLITLLILMASAEAADVAGKILIFKTREGLAVRGYDPVAYFTDNKAVKGNARFSSEYQGARYLFASADHKALFDGDPAKYAPAYGGFCGYAASVGKVRPANSLIWSIVDGRLILQHTKGADELWKKEVSGNKAKADKYWPLLVKAKAGKKDPIDSLFGKSVLNLAGSD